MHPLITAALLMCSTGDTAIADKIAMEAARQDTDLVVALTIGLMESGYQSGNPMGVRGCYPQAKKKTHRTDNDCIRIGVTSIHNRLWDAHTSMPIVADIKRCSGTGNMRMCRALANYNNSPAKYTYAKKGMALIRKFYKLAGISMPNT